MLRCFLWAAKTTFGTMQLGCSLPRRAAYLSQMGRYTLTTSVTCAACMISQLPTDHKVYLHAYHSQLHITTVCQRMTFMVCRSWWHVFSIAAKMALPVVAQRHLHSRSSAYSLVYKPHHHRTCTLSTSNDNQSTTTYPRVVSGIQLVSATVPSKSVYCTMSRTLRSDLSLGSFTLHRQLIC